MDRARSALTRLARAELDNDSFRYEAAAILRRAVGFDGWCWLLADPAAQLLTRELGEDMVVDKGDPQLPAGPAGRLGSGPGASPPAAAGLFASPSPGQGAERRPAET